MIGYESAAKIAQEALATGRTIRQVAQEKKLFAEEDLEKLLNPAHDRAGYCRGS